MPMHLGILLGTPLASRSARCKVNHRLARFLLGALRKSLILNDLRKDGCEAPRLRNPLGCNDLRRSVHDQLWGVVSSDHDPTIIQFDAHPVRVVFVGTHVDHGGVLVAHPGPSGNDVSGAELISFESSSVGAHCGYRLKETWVGVKTFVQYFSVDVVCQCQLVQEIAVSVQPTERCEPIFTCRSENFKGPLQFVFSTGYLGHVLRVSVHCG